METIQQSLNKVFKSSNHSSSYFTCEICMEPVPLKERFKNMEASGCSHPYCTACVAKYIETKVIHNNMSDIKCPNTNCSVLLDALSCRSILSKKVFEKWCRVLCESAVLLDASKGGFVHGRSFCPNRKCSELILNECEGNKSSLKRSDCPHCKQEFCFSCMATWEENHRCRQTGDSVIDIDMDRNDVLFMEMVKRKKWTRCPACNHYIQRVLVGEGYCSHVYCRCRTEFCCDCREWPCVCKRKPVTCRDCLICLLVYGFIIGLIVLFGILVDRGNH